MPQPCWRQSRELHPAHVTAHELTCAPSLYVFVLLIVSDDTRHGTEHGSLRFSWCLPRLHKRLMETVARAGCFGSQWTDRCSGRPSSLPAGLGVRLERNTETKVMEGWWDAPKARGELQTPLSGRLKRGDGGGEKFMHTHTRTLPYCLMEAGGEGTTCTGPDSPSILPHAAFERVSPYLHSEPRWKQGRVFHVDTQVPLSPLCIFRELAMRGVFEEARECLKYLQDAAVKNHPKHCCALNWSEFNFSALSQRIFSFAGEHRPLKKKPL